MLGDIEDRFPPAVPVKATFFLRNQHFDAMAPLCD
jgi:hypothetical protein